MRSCLVVCGAPGRTRVAVTGTTTTTGTGTGTGGAGAGTTGRTTVTVTGTGVGGVWRKGRADARPDGLQCVQHPRPMPHPALFSHTVYIMYLWAPYFGLLFRIVGPPYFGVHCVLRIPHIILGPDLYSVLCICTIHDSQLSCVNSHPLQQFGSACVLRIAYPYCVGYRIRIRNTEYGAWPKVSRT